jgi:hypothetical protein
VTWAAAIASKACKAEMIAFDRVSASSQTLTGNSSWSASQSLTQRTAELVSSRCPWWTSRPVSA